MGERGESGVGVEEVVLVDDGKEVGELRERERV